MLMSGLFSITFYHIYGKNIQTYQKHENSYAKLLLFVVGHQPITQDNVFLNYKHMLHVFKTHNNSQ